MAAAAKTMAATTEPLGVASSSATTSTGTSRMRKSVRTFGTFSGNIVRSVPGSALLSNKDLEADQGAERPRRRHRRGQQRPWEDPLDPAPEHEQGQRDPAEPVDPAEHELKVLVEATDPGDEQRAEDDRLDCRVEPDALEVGHPNSVEWMRKRFSPMISPATSVASAVVRRAFTKLPMTVFRLVRRISGTSANGIPNESTTCEITSVCVGSTPIASTMSAGVIVAARRRNSGILRAMKPCMTTWPANVPTLELDRPEASRATANASAAPPPSSCSKPVCAPTSVSTPVRPLSWNSAAATTSMARLMAPATPSATTTSKRWNRT